MIMHPTDDDLHDWADGSLDPSARPAVERHLAGCDDCRRQVERLHGLLALAAGAPRTTEPEDDLWPAIRARIAPDVRPLHPASTATATSAAAPSQRRPRRALQLLAAGLAIAAASSALTLRIARDRTATVAGRDAAPAATGAATVTGAPAGGRSSSDAAAQYARAADELASAWRRAQAPLDPVTVAALDENLRAIDQAIAESRRAFAASPDDPLLAEIVEAAYRRKVELLRRALELPAWS